MLPDRVSNPGPLDYESGALPIALCGPAFSSVTWQPNKREMARNLWLLFALFQRKGWDMKSRYVSLRKNPADSPDNKNKLPGKRHALR